MVTTLIDTHYINYPSFVCLSVQPIILDIFVNWVGNFWGRKLSHISRKQVTHTCNNNFIKIALHYIALQFPPQHTYGTLALRTSFQYRFLFDVRKERDQRLWCDHKPYPNHTLLSQVGTILGENTGLASPCIILKNKKGAHTLLTDIMLVVRVPVLSEQMTEVQPRVSTDGKLLTMAFFLAMRRVPRARQVVMTAGRPSGMAATARATAILK